MPELPEVESIADVLRVYLLGRKIMGVYTKPSRVFWYPEREEFEKQILDNIFQKITRHGKFIFCSMMPGKTLVPSGKELIFHLGMTGHLFLVRKEEEVDKHTHLRLVLDSEYELRFEDIRMFGRVLFGTVDELIEKKVLPILGEEANSTGFTLQYLANIFTGKASVKAYLLDQSGIAGLGNIYIDESCFLAGINPGKKADRISERELRALHSAINSVLRRALEQKGTSFSDYFGVFGEKGGFQKELMVYGRKGEACKQCHNIIQRGRVAGRGTYFCPNCQPL